MPTQKEKPPEFDTDPMFRDCRVCKEKHFNLTIHLREKHDGMTPTEYRKKFKLPDDYGMLAPGRSRKGIKLGPRKPKTGKAIVPYQAPKGPQLILTIDLNAPIIEDWIVPSIDAMLKKKGIGEVAHAHAQGAPAFTIYKKQE